MAGSESESWPSSQELVELGTRVVLAGLEPSELVFSIESQVTEVSRERPQCIVMSATKSPSNRRLTCNLGVEGLVRVFAHVISKQVHCSGTRRHVHSHRRVCKNQSSCSAVIWRDSPERFVRHTPLSSFASACVCFLCRRSLPRKILEWVYAMNTRIIRSHRGLVFR